MTFNIAFGLWLLFGLLCAGMSAGWHEITWEDICFKEALRLLLIFLLGPINLVFAIGRGLGYAFSH